MLFSLHSNTVYTVRRKNDKNVELNLKKETECFGILNKKPQFFFCFIKKKM